ncbi:TPA: hypothetical protein ACIBTJ_000964 [Salmonella enterica subsp. enterica serovar Wangata]
MNSKRGHNLLLKLFLGETETAWNFLDAHRVLLDNGVSLEVVIRSTRLSCEELEKSRH